MSAEAGALPRAAGVLHFLHRCAGWSLQLDVWVTDDARNPEAVGTAHLGRRGKKCVNSGKAVHSKTARLLCKKWEFVPHRSVCRKGRRGNSSSSVQLQETASKRSASSARAGLLQRAALRRAWQAGDPDAKRPARRTGCLPYFGQLDPNCPDCACPSRFFWEHFACFVSDADPSFLVGLQLHQSHPRRGGASGSRWTQAPASPLHALSDPRG